MVIVWEILLDRVKRVPRIGIASLAGGQVEVNQVGRGVVANGVPVLLAFVRAQGMLRVKRDRIKVREIATLGPIEEKAVEQVDC